MSETRQKIEPPRFASEAEEAAWLDEHRDVLEENFVAAVETGEARVGGVADRATRSASEAPNAESTSFYRSVTKQPRL